MTQTLQDLRHTSKEFIGGPTLAQLEREHIEARLKCLHYNKTATAKSLGISLKTLYNRLHSYRQSDAQRHRGTWNEARVTD